jgi:hypothetical protein
VHALLLKVAATALTLGAAVAAAVHVSGHVKDRSAPLQPAVVGTPAVPDTSRGGKLALSPGVRSGDARTVTSTYAS